MVLGSSPVAVTTQITHFLLYDTQKFRGVATNRGPGEPGSSRDLFCIVSTNVVQKRLIFLHRVNNIEHNIKQNIYAGMEVIFYLHDTAYKNIYFKNDASGEKN